MMVSRRVASGMMPVLPALCRGGGKVWGKRRVFRCGLHKLTAEVKQRLGGGSGGDGVAQRWVGDDARLAGPVLGGGKVWGKRRVFRCGSDELVAEVKQRFGGGGGGDGVAQRWVGDDARLAGSVRGGERCGESAGFSGVAVTNLRQRSNSASVKGAEVMVSRRAGSGMMPVLPALCGVKERCGDSVGRRVVRYGLHKLVAAAEQRLSLISKPLLLSLQVIA